MRFSYVFKNFIKKLFRLHFILDITGIILRPGNYGKDCKGNGTYVSRFGRQIECCCDGCDYFMCCFKESIPSDCSKCNDIDCPRLRKIKN